MSVHVVKITQGFNHAQIHSNNVSAWQHTSMYCDILDISNPGVLGVCSWGIEVREVQNLGFFPLVLL